MQTLLNVGIGCYDIVNYAAKQWIRYDMGGGGGATVATHSPPTSEVGGSNPGPDVGKLVVAYQWSAVYSTKP